MKSTDQHRLGTLFIAEMARLPQSYWPDDPYAFGRVLKQLQPTNVLAQRFWVADGTLGWVSPDFRDMRTMMHTATLISYNSQNDDRFYVEIGPRAVDYLIRRIEATPEESANAKEILLAHWQEVYGRPWEKT